MRASVLVCGSMKIVSLNTWGGRLGQPFLEFFISHRDVDVFLLQEVFQNATEKTCWNENCRPNLFQDLTALLPEHIGIFAPSVAHEWGQAAFVKKSIRLNEYGDLFVHKTMDSLDGKDGTSIGRNIQWMKIDQENEKPLFLLNFHGLWTGIDKNDTQQRLEQSMKIVELLKSLDGRIVLCGDFNLNPGTESLQMIVRELGLRNLVVEYGIPTTRTKFYTKPEKFADYMLVSPEINVRDFKVLPDEISDHAPLFLEF